MSKTAIKLIRYYQAFSRTVIWYNALPLLFPSQCRFYPSCSEYMIQTIENLGFWRGFAKGVLRVLKCNPYARDL